jgi:hypothetical protein
VRRLAGDAPATVIVVLAGALATATFSVAVLLRDSANDAATRKADTFVGADLALDTAGDHALPSSLADRTTRVARLDARAGDTPVDVLAIDPTTFARAASGLDARTAGAVDALGAGHLDAVVAGGALPTTDLDIDGSAIAVDVVETVDVFPGLRSGAPLVVVDARSLPSTVTKKADEIWLHDPPVDAVAQLQAAGFPVYGVRTPQRVFDAVSFLAVDWSFAGMQAFGLAIGALVVLVQLLVVAARRRQREVAWIVSRRMAVRTATHRRAIAVELGVPTGLAVAGGLALACTAARLAAGALDPRPELPPSAGFVVNPSVFAAVAIAGVIVLLVLGAVATAALTRVDAIEVVRGEG